MGDVEWGSVGEWVGGLGGLLAVVAVTVVARLEHKARKAEEARRQREDDNRSRSQAVQIYATQTSREDREGGVIVCRWAIENASESIVYDVVAKVSGTNELHRRDLPLAPSKNRPVEHTREWPIGTERPVIGLEIEFRDFTGKFWSRDLDGNLREGRLVSSQAPSTTTTVESAVRE